MDAGTNDPSSTFSLRLRVQNGATVHSENVTINPNTQLSPRTIEFDWPAVTVTSPTIYEVAVYQGGDEERDRAFTLKPPLVRIMSIAPDPFFPWINDDYKDTTDVTYRLASTSEPVIVHVYESDTDGTCCGALVREADLFTHRRDPTLHLEREGRRGRPPPERGLLGSDHRDGPRWDHADLSGQGGLDRPRLSGAQDGQQERERVPPPSPTTVLAAGGTCGLQRLTVPKDLRIDCDDARVRVFWRWSLPASGDRVRLLRHGRRARCLPHHEGPHGERLVPPRRRARCEPLPGRQGPHHLAT